MAKRLAANRTIEVILLEQDKHLGEKYEIVRVKPIFAKNVLLPANKVVLATPATINQYKVKMEKAQADIKRKVASIEGLFAKMAQDGGIVITKKVNEKGSLYDKVDTQEIAHVVQETYGVAVDTHNIKLKGRLAATGTYKVPYKFKMIEKDLIVTVKGISDKPVEKKEETVKEVSVGETVVTESKGHKKAAEKKAK